MDTLVTGVIGPGGYQVTWDGRDDTGSRLPSGVYFLRLAAPGVRDPAKVTLLDR